MAGTFVASRAQLVYALCLPVAVLMGYFLASPTDSSSIAIVVAIFSLLMVPVLMKYYHPLLVVSWNASVTPYFLPGSPYLWMLMAFVGFGFAAVNRFTNPNARLVEVKWINRSLALLLLVVVGTAMLRGGIGVRAMGSSSYGGKNYIFVVAAILGYFAFISQRIAIHRAKFYAAAFFLSALTALIPNLVFLGGPGLYFLYFLFPAALAVEQAVASYSPGAEFMRITGLTLSSMGLFCWLLASYGLRGIFDWSKPWRLVLLAIAFAACLFTGFRSILLLFLMVGCIQFYLEGLHRTRVLAVVFVTLIVGAIVALPNADKLPPVMQRSLSFLPLEISPTIRQDVAGSTDWRWRMWQDLIHEVPRYLLLGKGYAINPGELEFAQENVRRGYTPSYNEAMIAGNYHSGPLTLVIPFGIWGLLAFVAFLACGWRYLLHQYRHGLPELKNINRLILTLFTARVLLFFLIYGSFTFDLFAFTGLIGFGVSLNGPLGAKEEVMEAEAAEEVFAGAEKDWSGT